MGLKYPLDSSGDLAKVTGCPLIRNPSGWFLKVPSGCVLRINTFMDSL